MDKGYAYSYEDIYDILMAIETIERFIKEGKPNKAISNLKALKEGFRRTLYQR